MSRFFLHSSCLILLSLSFVACNGSSTSVTSEEEQIEFDVPPLPTSFADGSENNQEPPSSLLVPEFVPRTPIDDVSLSAADREAAESEALALVRQHMRDQGFSDDHDVGAPQIVQDEFGRIRVKFPAVYKGIPVIGASISAYFGADLLEEVNDGLIPGIDAIATPRITEEDALDIAMAAYPLRDPAVTQRLAVLPELDLVNLGNPSDPERAEDYSYQLADSRLVWELTLSAPDPVIDDVIIDSINNSPSNDEPDDEILRAERGSNLTHGGHDAENKEFEAFTTALENPPVLFRIDAITGEVIEERNMLEQADWEHAVGPGYSYYSGEVELNTILWNANNRYYLIDNSRPNIGSGLGNTVYDADNKKTHDISQMSIPADFNNSWGDASIVNTENSGAMSTRRQTPAVDVAFGIQTAWDMFDNVLYRYGFDGNGAKVRACVHYDKSYTDAHYNSSSKMACFGDNDENDAPGLFDLPWVGHELGHNFWHAAGNASESGESSALNEGHGDIMGSLVDFYRHTSNGTGNRISHFLNLADWQWRLVIPEKYTEDEGDTTYKGRKYWSADLKDIPEHVGGLPFGRAFIYLAEGAPDDSDNTLFTTEFPNGLGGIGLTKAAHIWKTAVALYIDGTPNYVKMRNAFLFAAYYLYGGNSMEYRAVERAFAAIRLGSPANDVQKPEIKYAKIFGINLTDMTAQAMVIAGDDTGIRQVRINNHENNGIYMHDGFAYGYVNISRPPEGQHSFAIEVEDSDGKTVATNRTFTKARNRNLIINGDFEDGMDNWTSGSGKNHIGNDARRAFIGNRYLAITGNDTVYQEVAVPVNAKNIKLVFRLLIRNSADEFDTLAAVVTNTGNQVIKVLETYNYTSPKEGRNWLNKGFLRQEFDLGGYAGQTVRIGFSSLNPEDKASFVIDQVVLTYTEDVFVDNPKVTLAEWENTVAFQLPTITGLEQSEINRVEYYVDKELVAISDNPAFDYYGAAFLDDIGPGAHWAGAIVRGLDNAKLAQTKGVWFIPRKVNELLVNGDFEDGPWNLTYSDPPPRVEVVENFIDATNVFDGNQGLRIGGIGETTETRIGQEVTVPKNIKTLDFSVRMRINSVDLSDNNPNNDDRLVLELWNANTFEKIDELVLADFTDNANTVGLKDFFANYWREDLSLQPGKYAGKKLVVIIKNREFNDRQTTFYVDNASLRYTKFGLADFP